jgi:hypothetical protein
VRKPATSDKGGAAGDPSCVLPACHRLSAA